MRRPSPRRALAPLVLATLALPTVAHAYGEPDAAGRPSRRERILLVLTNQIRQAPHEWPGWNTALAPADALPTLAGLPSLHQSARFHAEDLAQTGTFAHESSDGTPFGQRVSRYFQGAAGENIYKASWESPVDAMTGWMNSDGHRANILKPDWTWLGTGYAFGSGAHHWVQNFGRSAMAERPRIPAAAGREIESLEGPQLELRANWSAEGVAATSVSAELDGRCVPLARASGAPDNSTWLATTERPDRCSPLVFVAAGEDGESVRYPSRGAFRIGPGCDAEWAEAAPEPICGGAPVVIDAERGCAATGQLGRGGALSGLALLGLAVLRRRRR